MKLKPSPNWRIDTAPTIAAVNRCAPDIPSQGRLEALFREHEANLLRFLMIRLGSMADARDCLQVVFTRLLERSAQLADENLVSLLYVCARNVATDELRHRQRIGERAASESEGANVADDRPCLDRHVQATQDLALLMSLLEELPPKCRRAFVSYKLEGVDYAGIATSMGITESMVRKYVIKAVAYCARRFEELQGWE